MWLGNVARARVRFGEWELIQRCKMRKFAMAAVRHDIQSYPWAHHGRSCLSERTRCAQKPHRTTRPSTVVSSEQNRRRGDFGIWYMPVEMCSLAINARGVPHERGDWSERKVSLTASPPQQWRYQHDQNGQTSSNLISSPVVGCVSLSDWAWSWRRSAAVRASASA